MVLLQIPIGRVTMREKLKTPEEAVSAAEAGDLARQIAVHRIANMRHIRILRDTSMTAEDALGPIRDSETIFLWRNLCEK